MRSLQDFLLDIDAFPVSSAPPPSHTSTAGYRPPDSSVPVAERPFMFYNAPGLLSMMIEGLRNLLATSFAVPIDADIIPGDYAKLCRKASSPAVQSSEAGIERVWGALPELACDCRDMLVPDGARSQELVQVLYDRVNVKPDSALCVGGRTVVIVEAKTGTVFDAHAANVSSLLQVEYLGWNGIGDERGCRAIYLKVRHQIRLNLYSY